MTDKEKKKRKQKKKTNEKETINKQKKNRNSSGRARTQDFHFSRRCTPRPYIRNNENKKLKRWDDSPETFYEAEASNRLTLRLEISALPRYPE